MTRSSCVAALYAMVVVMTAPALTPLQTEFAPLIIERFEQTYRPGRHMSERAQQNIVYRPLADLEALFPEDLLRAALKETLARLTFGPNTRRWSAYTRAVARNWQTRAVAAA